MVVSRLAGGTIRYVDPFHDATGRVLPERLRHVQRRDAAGAGGGG